MEEQPRKISGPFVAGTYPTHERNLQLSGENREKKFPKKNAYQAKQELLVLEKEIRGMTKTMAETLDAAAIAEKARQCEVLLASQLPSPFNNESFGGWLACRLLAVWLQSVKAMPAVNTFLAQVDVLTEKALLLLPLKQARLNLISLLDEIYLFPSLSERVQHQIQRAEIEAAKDDAALTLEDLQQQGIFNQNLFTKLQAVKKLHALFQQLRQANDKTEKDYQTLRLKLLGIANFYYEQANHILSDQHLMALELWSYAMMFYHATRNTSLKHFPEDSLFPEYMIAASKKVEAQLLLTVQANSTTVDPWQTHVQLAARLKNLRDDIEAKLAQIPAFTAQNDEEYLARAEKLRSIVIDLVGNIKHLVTSLVKECIDLLGEPPCNYSFIGFGSLEKQSCTPYSDLEFGILIEENLEAEKEKQAKLYFQHLSYLLHAKIIHLGETPIPFSLFGFSFDHLTGMGLCFDLGGKISLGRRYDDIDRPNKDQYGTFKYTLIHSPSQMLTYVEDEAFAIDKLLPVEIGRCTHICGDAKLTEDYLALVKQRFQKTNAEGQTFYQQRALTLLDGNTYLLGDLEAYEVDLSLDGKLFDVKKEIYRVPDRLIDDLAFYYGITIESAWEKLGELHRQGIITEMACKNLRIIDGIATEIRLHTYQHYKQQKEVLSVIIKTETTSQQNFQLSDHHPLMRFYYSAIPLHQAMEKFAVGNVNIVQHENFLQQGLSLQADIYERLLNPQQAKRCLEEALAAAPEDTAILLKLISTLDALGEHTIAKTWAESILRLTQSMDPATRDVWIAEANSQLCRIYLALGDAANALACQQQAFTLFQSLYGERHTKVRFALSLLGGIYNLQGKYQASLLPCIRAAEIAANYTLKIGTHPFQLTPPSNDIYYLYREHGHWQLVYFQKSGRPTLMNIKNTEWAALLAQLDPSNITANIEQPLREKLLVLHLRHNASVLKSRQRCALAISLGNIGLAYDHLGQASAALDHYQQALVMQKDLFGDRHPTIAASLNNIGLAYDHLGQASAALDHYQQALAMLKALFGDRHPHIATSLNNIGGAYDHLGQTSVALDHFQQGLVMRKTLFGNRHPDIATSLNNIGGAYDDLGLASAALEHYQQALAIQKALFGERHPAIAALLNNIGESYRALGQASTALDHCQQALAMQRDLFGDRHPHIATSLNNIGEVYRVLGQTSVALDHYQQALAMLKALFGDRHPHIATCLNNIGLAYADLRQFYTALNHFQQALAMRKALFGDRHPDIATSLNNIGLAYDALGQASATLAHFQQALAMRKALFGDRHPAIATTLANIACCHYKQAQWELAVASLRELINVQYHCFAAQDPRFPRIAQEREQQVWQQLQAKKAPFALQWYWLECIDKNSPPDAAKLRRYLSKASLKQIAAAFQQKNQSQKSDSEVLAMMGTFPHKKDEDKDDKNPGDFSDIKAPKKYFGS